MNLAKARQAKQSRTLRRVHQTGKARQALGYIDSDISITDDSSSNDDNSNNTHDSSSNDDNNCNNTYDCSSNDDNNCNNICNSSKIKNGLNSIAYIRLQRQYNALKRQNGKLKSLNHALNQSLGKYKQKTHFDHAIQCLSQLIRTKKVSNKKR